MAVSIRDSEDQESDEMAARVKLVVLAHYPDIWEGFRELVERWEPEIAKILIADGPKLPRFMSGWTIVEGTLPFNYSRNVNLGWTVTGTADVILCGDDIRFDGPFVAALQEAAYSDSTVGVSTVQLHGQSPFVCGYFKRSVLDKVGPMDECFNAYGEDDMDWCHRMELLGYHTLCTDQVSAQHNGGSTFFRRQRELGGESIEAGNLRMKRIYEEKWGKDKLHDPLENRIKLK